MSSSSSNLPTIILVGLAVIILGGFYYLDRSSSSPDIAAITETADTEAMATSKEKYEADKSAYAHAGFSGSMKDYIAHTEGGMEAPKDVKQHSGYSGSGDDYAQKYKDEEIGAIVKNVDDHAGFSGSMKDYMAGKYSTRSSSKTTASASKPASSKPSPSSSSSNTGSHGGYTGSVNDYLNKYK